MQIPHQMLQPCLREVVGPCLNELCFGNELGVAFLIIHSPSGFPLNCFIIECFCFNHSQNFSKLHGSKSIAIWGFIKEWSKFFLYSFVSQPLMHVYYSFHYSNSLPFNEECVDPRFSMPCSSNTTRTLHQPVVWFLVKPFVLQLWTKSR